MTKWCFSKKLKAAMGATLTVLLIMGAWHSLGFWEIMLGPKWNSFSVAHAEQAQKNDEVERKMIQLNEGFKAAYILTLQAGLSAERKALFEYGREARKSPDNEELAELMFNTEQRILEYREKIKAEKEMLKDQ